MTPLYDRSQHTCGVAALRVERDRRGTGAVGVARRGNFVGAGQSAPTSGVCANCTECRFPTLLRALPKAIVGTAIAAASPTAVKANSRLFSM